MDYYLCYFLVLNIILKQLVRIFNSENTTHLCPMIVGFIFAVPSLEMCFCAPFNLFHIWKRLPHQARGQSEDMGAAGAAPC